MTSTPFYFADRITGEIVFHNHEVRIEEPHRFVPLDQEWLEGLFAQSDDPFHSLTPEQLQIAIGRDFGQMRQALAAASDTTPITGLSGGALGGNPAFIADAVSLKDGDTLHMEGVPQDATIIFREDTPRVETDEILKTFKWGKLTIDVTFILTVAAAAAGVKIFFALSNFIVLPALAIIVFSYAKYRNK